MMVRQHLRGRILKQTKQKNKDRYYIYQRRQTVNNYRKEKRERQRQRQRDRERGTQRQRDRETET